MESQNPGHQNPVHRNTVQWISSSRNNQELAERYHASLDKTNALTEVEADRRRMDVDHYEFKPGEN